MDVTLLPGGSDIAPLLEVLERRADYAIEAGELVYYRLQGKPVVALASIFQHSPAMLMTEGKAGLRTPHDLAHKRIGMQVGGQPIVEIAAMFVNEGVTLDALALQPNRPGMDALLSGQVDADYGYMTSEPFFNTQTGRDIHYIQPITYGVDFYGDTLFTSERHLEEHPAQVAALRRAVVRGWQYALENPDDMITVLLKRYPQLNREALQFEAARIHELVKPDIVKIGHMNSERWRRMADTYTHQL
ncbi:ABC-type nitrate/sulfonate/bicarbonate transport system, substrate-binding protein [Thiothrix caldifontis]|uniref:Thiamine pyrimidine synthase n=1 Tax=Thiothrix caldifontis TaxID=525918 RepID=A0A1H4GEM8_9GAMM|nr:ABC transporter substrate-binding protein [Thiothrix caldifontis]SEB07470.1 ABC-type nitrate/sulfonate/bicarbonate transport system, substrate-binding protein [Thiothrix caldifontis]